MKIAYIVLYCSRTVVLYSSTRQFAPVFHARHCRVPNKVPNGPSSRILLAARSSSTSLRARLFDSAIRFGVSAGGAARLWCSTTIFFAKIYQFRVGFGKPYREAPFPHVGGGVLLALFACSTPCSAHLLGGLLDSAARKTYLYRPIRFDCSFDYVGYPSLYSVRYSTSKSCREWNPG